MVKWNREHPDSNSGPGWHKRNRERSRILTRNLNYKRIGTTLPEYEALWHSQNGKCANPRCDFTADLIMSDYRSGLQVDHDHKTGEVRGLLCPKCNGALGRINDNLKRMRGLIEYLERKN
jgi:hypothetical protein